MDARVYNNVIGFVNDEGIRAGGNGRMILEYNFFDMGCDTPVSGPCVIRYVFPKELPLGVLYSSGDIVSDEAKTCLHTVDSGYITPPEPPPFEIPYSYTPIKSREELLKFVGTPQ